MEDDKARLLFAAMVGANMLSRAAGDAEWVRALKKPVKDAAAHWSS
jgi:TetR/AcrR family transcriptional regulator, transcriptional repressor for nem operon